MLTYTIMRELIDNKEQSNIQMQLDTTGREFIDSIADEEMEHKTGLVYKFTINIVNRKDDDTGGQEITDTSLVAKSVCLDSTTRSLEEIVDEIDREMKT